MPITRKHRHEVEFKPEDVREAIAEYFRGKDLPVRIASGNVTLCSPTPSDVTARVEWYEHPGEEEAAREAARVFVQLRIQEILEIAARHGVKIAASSRQSAVACASVSSKLGDTVSIDLTPETLRVFS